MSENTSTKEITKYERQIIIYLILHDHPDWGVGVGGGGGVGGAIYMGFQAV